MRHWKYLPFLCWATACAFAAAPQFVDKAVVVITVEFSDAPTDMGSGFFVDHDGLIATADHVIRGLTTPASGTSGPAQTKHPKRITVYSAYLQKSFVIEPGNFASRVVAGQISSGK